MLFAKKSIHLPIHWYNNLNKEMKHMFDYKYNEYCMQDFFVDPFFLLEDMLEDFLPNQLRTKILNRRKNYLISISFCRLMRKSIEDVYKKVHSKKVERPATLAEECIIYGILDIFKDVYFDSLIIDKKYDEAIKDGIPEKELQPQIVKNKIHDFVDEVVDETFEDTDFLDLWGGPLFTKITNLNGFFDPYYLEQRDLTRYPLLNK